jgi:DNA-binding protein H-NS
MLGHEAIVSASLLLQSTQIYLSQKPSQPRTVARCAPFWMRAPTCSHCRMPKPNLSSMSVDALLKLRDDIGEVLTRRAVQLRDELSKLGGGERRSSIKGRRVPVKFRDRSGNRWAGRGAQPVWLREKLKAGAKLEDFAVQKTGASRKTSPRKSKKRRRAKR